jgi:glyoxylase-like metal-dependent hydrolase (beta-lactamase superfamily II)
MASATPRLPASIHVLERGWLSSNSIVFFDGKEASVVDTGYCLHAEQTARLIDRVRAERPLTRIINTHLHSDHVGGNARLRAQHRAAIAIPPGLAAAVDAWDEDALSYAPTGQQCPRFGYDMLFFAGDTLQLGGLTWEVLAAPGHDPHMVMLFNEDERILISADALWQNGFGALFAEIEGQSCFGEQRMALELIARRQPRVVIPGHGAPFSEVSAALDRAHGRLAALSSSPERNARHVMKVLIKFWLLQEREAKRDEAYAHFGATRYFQLIYRRYFAEQSFAAMIDRSIQDLVRSGAVTVAGHRIQNCD